MESCNARFQYKVQGHFGLTKIIDGKEVVLPGFKIREQNLRMIFGYKHISMNQSKFLKISESIVKEVTSAIKKAIVVKSGSVAFNNITSNAILSAVYGVPIKYQVEKMLEGVSNLRKYLNNNKSIIRKKIELDSLIHKKGRGEFLSETDHQEINSLNAEIALLNDENRSNPVLALIRAGLFQSIAEDTSVESVKDKYSYVNDFNNMFSSISDRIPNAVKSTAEEIYMTDKSLSYKTFLQITQYSDFVSRYATYKHLTEVQRMNKNEALELVEDLFVNYALPTNKYLQYSNDTFPLLFTKYPLRILRMIRKTMNDRTFSVLGVELFDSFAFSIPFITDSNPVFNGLNLNANYLENAFNAFANPHLVTMPTNF